MCEPASLISLGLVAVNAVTGVAGANAEAAKEQQAIEINKRMGEIAAADATSRGEKEASIARLKGKQIVGQQQAAAGASGVDAGSTSVVKLAEETAAMAEYDAQTIRANAAREAWGYKGQGLNYGLQAEMSKLRQQNRNTGTILGAVGDSIGYTGMLKKGGR